MSLAEAAELPVSLVGSKAAILARLAEEGFPVPPGLVVLPAAWSQPASRVATEVAAALADGKLGATALFAVRSSAAAEDLAGASYAGQYETYLNVAAEDVPEAAQRCVQAATAPRVVAYRASRDDDARQVEPTTAVAVLIQPMVAAKAAGVAFTANPVTGDRAETVVTAVRGISERLVGGESAGDEWSVRAGVASPRRTAEQAITADDACAVAVLASRIAEHLGGPQDIEWAIQPSDHGDDLILLQARPMTALPDPVIWEAPGPGLWWRNFRLGEWLPDPVTPLFADWLLPQLEIGYVEGMRETLGAGVGFRYAVVHGRYFNALPILTFRKVVEGLRESGTRGIRVLYQGIAKLAWDPAGADRDLLGHLYRRWCEVELPDYRELVRAAEQRLPSASQAELITIVDRIGRTAGRHLWFLAFEGGAAWKMENRLTHFASRHLRPLTEPEGPLADGVQVLLRALPGSDPRPPEHALFSADWYWPTHGETGLGTTTAATVDPVRRRRLVEQRQAAETACREALARMPARQRRFTALVDVTRRYTVIRETQAREWTLGWPLLRGCAKRLGEALVAAGYLDDPEQVFFLTRSELSLADSHIATASERRARWRQQRRLAAPLTLGRPPRIGGDPLARAARTARGTRSVPDDAIVGEPASAGRASGPVRLITDIAEFHTFRSGDILLARATTPAWTPLFPAAAAVITDSGTVSAHASIVAREYGIPAVVGTGDATHRLRTGQWVTVDGAAGTIILEG